MAEPLTEDGLRENERVWSEYGTDDVSATRLLATISALRAERDRYREHLQWIIDADNGGIGSGVAANLARAALRTGGE